MYIYIYIYILYIYIRTVDVTGIFSCVGANIIPVDSLNSTIDSEFGVYDGDLSSDTE